LEDILFVIASESDNSKLVIWLSVCHRWRNIVKKMLEPNKFINKNDYTKVVARKGYVRILIWALDNGCNWHLSTCLEAAKNRKFKCFAMGF